MTRGALLGLGLAIAAAGAAAAQSVPESVTVTGTKSHQVIEKFVESLATPTRIAGKIARWEVGVCPLTVGLKSAFTKYISRRVRDVAAKAGVPVSATADCKPNIEIVFTTTPQGLLDNVRKDRQVLLGYHDNSGQAERMAKITHPIQAWYATATVDLRGKSVLDSPAFQGVGEQAGVQGDAGQLIWSAAAVTGSRLGDGKSSALYHVIIAANPDKLADYEMGSLGDYIAMLALSQPASPDTCLALPSILNMLAPDCERKADALTANDMAYLSGLYRMSPGSTLRTQQDEIAYRMEQGLGR